QRLVVAITGSQAYPTRAGIVGPGGTRCGTVVIWLVVERGVATLTQWQQNLGGAVGRNAIIGVRAQVRIGVHGRRQAASMGTTPADTAIGRYRGDVANFVLGPGTERQLMVPQYFHRALGNREWHIAQSRVPKTVIHHLSVQRIPLGSLADHLGVSELAPPFIDIDLVGIGIALEHCLLAD